MGTFFYTHLYCLVRCLSVVVWTHAVLGVLYTCVLYFCICTYSAQLSMFHVEKCSRNRLIIIIVIVIYADRQPDFRDCWLWSLFLSNMANSCG